MLGRIMVTCMWLSDCNLYAEISLRGSIGQSRLEEAFISQEILLLEDPRLHLGGVKCGVHEGCVVLFITHGILRCGGPVGFPCLA